MGQSRILAAMRRILQNGRRTAFPGTCRVLRAGQPVSRSNQCGMRRHQPPPPPAIPAASGNKWRAEHTAGTANLTVLPDRALLPPPKRPSGRKNCLAHRPQTKPGLPRGTPPARRHRLLGVKEGREPKTPNRPAGTQRHPPQVPCALRYQLRRRGGRIEANHVSYLCRRFCLAVSLPTEAQALCLVVVAVRSRAALLPVEARSCNTRSRRVWQLQ